MNILKTKKISFQNVTFHGKVCNKIITEPTKRDLMVNFIKHFNYIDDVDELLSIIDGVRLGLGNLPYGGVPECDGYSAQFTASNVYFRYESTPPTTSIESLADVEEVLLAWRQFLSSPPILGGNI
jgi:hypothetical protein